MSSNSKQTWKPTSNNRNHSNNNSNSGDFGDNNHLENSNTQTMEQQHYDQQSQQEYVYSNLNSQFESQTQNHSNLNNSKQSNNKNRSRRRGSNNYNRGRGNGYVNNNHNTQQNYYNSEDNANFNQSNNQFLNNVNYTHETTNYIQNQNPFNDNGNYYSNTTNSNQPTKQQHPRKKKEYNNKKFSEKHLKEEDLNTNKEIKLSQLNEHSQSKPDESKEKTKGNKDVDGTHSVLSADIIHQLENDSYECMICCDTIKRRVVIWSCSNCYKLFHLYCVKKWCKSSDDSSWRCPGCQFIQVSKPSPKCYCGKVTDPQFNPYLIPHSCGENCGKKRVGTDCPHPCVLQCHPGNCPPCSSMALPKTCYCGKVKYQVRCGEGFKDKGKSCDSVCEKVLNCGKHKCKKICHAGPCSSCSETEIQMCYCGKNESTRTCGSGVLDKSKKDPRYYSCNSVCNQLLDCKNHNCQLLCHIGKCDPCELLPAKVTSCICGKIPLALLGDPKRKSCLDPIPTCPNKCEKILSCGIHKCTKNCHEGPCIECKEMRKITCLCHATNISLPCSKVTPEVLANTKCNKVCKIQKNCGKHFCGEKCCPSSTQADPHKMRGDPEGNHYCGEICTKKLKCGKHFCDLLCGHPTRCPPCHITSHEPYVCECGKTRKEPPILCGDKLPECPYLCIRNRECGHNNVPGFTHQCHARESECPKCIVPVDVMCKGGHQMKKNTPCHMSSKINCSRLCGRQLSCGNHSCKKVCHNVEEEPCVENNNEQSCGQMCGKKLPFCGHPCQSVCHGDLPCPRILCKHMITIFCPCKRRSVETECLRNDKEDDVAKNVTRELLCDEQCEIEIRNRKLAAAFDITTTPTSDLFSRELIDLGKASPQFVLKVEQKFAEIIKNSLMNKFSFPPMDRIQRRIIHEYSKVYALDTESFDVEPNRNVVVTRKKNSKIPNTLLSKLIQTMKENASLPRNDSANVAAINELTRFPSLHLYDIDPNVKSAHINNFLRVFEGHYQIKWVDDNNCLIIFMNAGDVKAAKYILSGPFQVREYEDQLIDFDSVTPNIHTVKDISKRDPQQQQMKSKELLQFKPHQPTWHSDQNYFSLLHENQNQNQDQSKRSISSGQSDANMNWRSNNRNNNNNNNNNINNNPKPKDSWEEI